MNAYVAYGTTQRGFIVSLDGVDALTAQAHAAVSRSAGGLATNARA